MTEDRCERYRGMNNGESACSRFEYNIKVPSEVLNYATLNQAELWCKVYLDGKTG